MFRKIGMENLLPARPLQSVITNIARWFVVVDYKEGHRNIHRFRLAQICLLLVFLLSCLFNIVSSLPYSLSITTTGVLYCIFLQYLNDRGYLKLSRIVLSVLMNFTALALCYVEGTSSGAYFFYFLVVIIATFIIPKEHYVELRVIYGLTFLMLALTFVVCP